MRIRNNLNIFSFNALFGIIGAALLLTTLPFQTNAAAIQGQSMAAAESTAPPSARASAVTTTLLFLGNENIAPVIFQENDAPAGVAVDITKALAPYLSQPIEIRAMNWPSAQTLVAEGKADALMQINQTEERKKIYDFSAPLLESQFSIFVRTDRVDISGLSSLHGLKVGVEKGGLPEQTLRVHPEIQLVIIPNFVEGFKQLSSGTLDAVVVDYRVGSYTLAINNIQNIRALGEPIAFSYSAFAVKKGNTKLLNEINTGLQTIKANGMYQAVLNKWKPTEAIFQTQEQITHEIYIAIISFLSIMTLIVIAWVRAMNRELSKRKKAEKYSEKLISSANAMIVCLDTKGNVITFNEMAEKISGYRKEEVLGRNWFELVVPRDRFPEVWKAFAKFQKKGKSIVVDFQNPILTKSGEERVIEWRNSDLLDDGNVIGTISYGIDVTERKQAERDRQANLKSLESMDKINRAIQGASGVDNIMREVLNATLSIFDCDRAWLFYPCDPDAPAFRVPMEVTKHEYPGAGILNDDVPLPPDMAQNLREALESTGPITFVAGTERPVNKVSSEQFGVKSMMMTAIYPKSGKPWALGLHQCSYPRVWTSEEKRLFQEISRRLTDGLTSTLMHRDLEKSEEKYRRLIETANEGVWVFDGEFKTTFANLRTLQMLGYTEKEMLGRKLVDFMAPEEIADHERKMEERRSGKPGFYERRFIRKDGKELWCSVSASPLFDEQKRFAGSFAMFTDITERKKAESALMESSARLNEAQHIAHLGSWELDLQSNKLTWSDEIYRIFEIDQKKFGATYEAFLNAIHPDDRKAVDEAYTNSLKTKIPYSIDHRLLFSDGRIKHVHEECKTFYDRNGKPIRSLGTVQDITERKLEEEQLKELDRLKDDFLSISTHELKTPLVPIKSQTQLLLAGDYGKLNQKQIEAVEMIARNEEALSKLSGDILDISKIKSNKLKLSLEKTSLGKIITEAVDDMRDLAGQKHITLSLSPIPKMSDILVDGSRIRQVMGNLLDNAIKFTPENGKVSVDIKKKAKEITVLIEDSGIGLSKDNIAKLFTPFFQIDSSLARKHRGTGLGLAITKGIVEAHGGSVRAESEGEGKGSTFIFSLPIS